MPAAFWPLLFMAVIFTVHGVNMVYMPVWYEKVRGLSGGQIGALFSTALLLRVVTGPLITAWAEGLPDPRRGYAALAACLSIAVAAAALAPNYALLIAAAFVIQNCASSLNAFAESSTVIATRTGSISYGFGRAIGSATFIIATTAMGFLLQRFNAWAAWTWVIVFALIAGVTIFGMPKPPVVSGAAKRGFRDRLRVMRELLQDRDFVRVSAASALIQAGHAFFYNFGALTWLKQGHSGGAIGLLWAIAVICEIVLLLNASRFLRGRDYEKLLLIGGLIGIVRWTLLSQTLPIWALVLVQTMHAGTFALSHFSTMQALDRIAGDRLPVAQTLYFSLGSGAFTGIATLAAGWLYQRYESGGYLAMAFMCAAGVLVLITQRPLKTTAEI